MKRLLRLILIRTDEAETLWPICAEDLDGNTLCFHHLLARR